MDNLLQGLGAFGPYALIIYLEYRIAKHCIHCLNYKPRGGD